MSIVSHFNDAKGRCLLHLVIFKIFLEPVFWRARILLKWMKRSKMHYIF